MTSYARRYSLVASSDRSTSPPPPYSTRPPSYHSHLNEQTPLFGTVKGSRPASCLIHWPTYECLAALLILVVPIVLFFSLYTVLSGPFHSAPLPPPPTYSVAIVGAGPAGISALQHLYLASRNRGIHVNITIFESAPFIGGQLALNDSTGSPVFPYGDPDQHPITAEDIAGTALVWSNPLFTKTSEAILGDQLQFSERPSQEVSYISGDRIVSQNTRPYSKTPFFKWMGLIFHYGSSVWQAGGLTKDGTELRDRFVGAPLTTDIMQLMISLGIIDPVQQFAQNGLDSRGIGGAYETEILSPQVERVHSQGIPNISTLAMMLAAAQEDYANAYIGGELVDRLEQIVAATGASVRTATKVSGVKHEQINDHESAWLVEYSARGLPVLEAEPFDRVILAAPSFDLYQVSSIDDVEAASVLTYHPTHVTFFTLPQRLNSDDFGDVDQILFHDGQGKYDAFRGFRELAFVREVVRVVDGQPIVEYLYRALSDEDIERELRDNLSVTWLYQARLENAHPDFFPSRWFPPFELSDKGMWWTSAIHAIGSTVDMSWLAGRIVAEEVLKTLRN
ncbi:hypothetical protein F5Y06DRAFT_292937 [Hypoxylon sp. FL0890]|nr:hypothetical protein F5Y06DRAFT_292937 [Hypoxylon sp. FL0890]